MTSAPANPLASDARQVQPLVVLLGPEDGSAPTPADEVDYLHVLEIGRFSGSQRLDYAVFEYDLAARGERLVDLQTPTKFGRQVQIRTRPVEADGGDAGDEDAPPADPGLLLFWGELTLQDIQIDRSERAIVTARVEPYHFLEILEGEEVWDPVGNAALTIPIDPRFNPLIDGVVVPNRSSKTDTPADASRLPGGYHLWIDPESARTAEARTYQGGGDEEDAIEVEEWTLTEAVKTICWLCNPTEELVNNPTLDDEQLDTDAGLQDVTLRRGRYLPEYLSALLQPYGFDWYVSHELDEEGNRQSEIVIYSRQDRNWGPEKQVYFQRPGETLDVSRSNVPNPHVETNIAELANRIVGEGGRKEYEVTVELVRAWSEADDSLTPDQLDATDEASDFESNRDVWRKWVANEAGDYIGLREDITEPLDLSSVLGDYVPRRRVFEDCLTLEEIRPGEHQRRRLPKVEYWDPDANEGVGVWRPIRWNCAISETEMSIYFTDPKPPQELFDLGADARIRVTGTITGDERLRATVSRRDSSPNARDVTLYLDLSSRFHYRERVTEGDLASVLEGEHDEADDEEDLREFLERVQDVEESATLRADLQVFGLDYSYEIGDLITRIEGRNISLNRNAATAAATRPLQVTGIVYLPQTNATRLIVEPTYAPAPRT